MTDAPLFNALGCAVRIDTSGLSAKSAAEVERVWSGARSEAGDPLPVAHLTVPVLSNIPLEDALSVLSQHVTFAALEARRGPLWMLHAAGVADSNGNVVALIGPSGQGKTTAARTLAREYGYVSDETVGIELDGTVVAYRKPLSVIEDAGCVKAQRSPAELSLNPLPQAPLRLAALVLLDRRADGPAEPIVEQCDLGDVLEELVAQTSYIADLPDPLRRIQAHADATGGIRRITYREAGSLAAALAPLFQAPKPVALPAAGFHATPVSSVSGHYRGAYLDALTFDDPHRVALLQPDLPAGATFRVIAGIGPALWLAANGSDLDQLTAAAESAYGTPDGVDATAAVSDAVRGLLDEGVLETEPAWRVRDDVAVTNSGERFVALSLSDLFHPAPVALEDSAAVIWEILAAARGITASKLVDAVAAHVGLEPHQVDGDVRQFLTALQDDALAEVIAP